MDYLLVFIAYLLGSIPSGYFIVKYFSKQDIRQLGSNSVGATNVGRVVGKKGLFLTIIIDLFKSFFFILYIMSYSENQYVLILSILGIVLGHIYPIFLKFKGGKGIVVTTGALLAYNYMFVILLIIFLSIVYIKIKNFTISGLIALLILPIFTIIYNGDLLLFLLLILLDIILLNAHKENIKKFKTQGLSK